MERHKGQPEKKPVREVMTGLYSALYYSAATGVIAARPVGLVWHWGEWEQSRAAGMAPVTEVSHRAVLLNCSLSYGCTRKDIVHKD